MTPDKVQTRNSKSGTFFGIELVDRVTRLCAMNLLLSGLGGETARIAEDLKGTK